eukprot:TRINITY_DN28788_c0_g1_i1.p1 TRINITY_DN28788_c0_g1~~TRINITY_DN28788_c0_g1_i1.p1  ORF type:complete len:578 (+),score=102.10 TRINITY_DN28788_c0_g1_i1:76-1809(+)
MSYAGESEGAGMLEMPLKGQAKGNAAAEDGDADVDNDVETGELFVAPPPNDDDENGWCAKPAQMVLDVLASIVFWYLMLFVPLPSDNVCWIGFGCFVIVMILYRFWLIRQRSQELNIPYTTGVVKSRDKEVYLVATLHISPKAPIDVEDVVEETNPDVVMIELDEERLDRMRDDEVAERKLVREADLQQVRITAPGREDVTIYAQRATWNAEWAGDTISGGVVFDEQDAFGTNPTENLDGQLYLVRRGAAVAGEFAPFALKAHKAAGLGAAAVLVINKDGELPVNRLGGDSLTGDLKTALYTCSCSLPPVPVLLLPHDSGEQLRQIVAEKGRQHAKAEFEVRSDTYPRRTLRRRLCQGCALIFSGIGVLYGVIQCFAVEVGGEFLAGEIAAEKKRIPCVCIDVDLDRFWSRLGLAVLPTPQNLGQALLAWLAFPRILFRLLFPPSENIDIPGSMVLHVMSFPLRTWVAFALAGFCASFVTSNILQLFSTGAEKAAEGSGVVKVDKQEDRDALQAWIMLAIEMYMMPRIYDAVAASRDEAMYQSIVAKSRNLGSRKMVVVVGAGHANGILQRIHGRGL